MAHTPNMHNATAQMVTSGPRKRKTLIEASRPQSTRVKALVDCLETRAANSDKLIIELCEEIDRLKNAVIKLAEEIKSNCPRGQITKRWVLDLEAEARKDAK